MGVIATAFSAATEVAGRLHSEPMPLLLLLNTLEPVMRHTAVHVA